MSAEQDTTNTTAPAATAPAAEEKPAEQKPAAAEAPAAAEEKPAAAAPETPYTKFAARLTEITKAAGHGEMWGVELKDPESHAPTKVILQKYLRANNNDPAAAEKQFKSALEWRKKVNAPALLEESFDEKAYGGLGYVTVHTDDKNKETVITWNVYGAVKDNKKTFGNLEEFIKWRAALMELGVRKLNLNDITEAIPEGGEDPHRLVQVHDYLSVSFLRADPLIKKASKETIQTLSMAYPELLAHKYFVNVPVIMGWMYAAMKLFLAPATLAKFHPMSSGQSLAAELPGIASTLPKEYGGKGDDVQKQGMTVKMAGAVDEVPTESPEAPVAAVTEPKGEEAAVADKLAETKIDDSKPTEEAKPAEETKAEEPKADAEAKPTEGDKKEAA